LQGGRKAVVLDTPTANDKPSYPEVNSKLKVLKAFLGASLRRPGVE